ncbi:AAA family ATPase [Arenicella xantha]|uniref:MoxR-like ATPase n=1 Tax=Arenicella xantha TaxID=644221 RepID=A0A395JG48_9GAMM|nr:MoxR family ATPase [Arenicella xantha]RBP48327.1 MoxR-like ATPase [Arenicella xantha]
MQKLDSLFDRLNTVILGNPLATKLAVVCLLARGHLLIEDIPGVGKTTLSHALANLFGLPFKRVQFTSDLLPTDIIGMTIFDMETKKFHFKKGPLFTSILLADEINRATPKSQSALLQAMEEKEVSVEGRQIALSDPFFVIATQNPLEQSGTFPLPESQLDRFLMRISLGYPSAEHERQLLLQKNQRATQGDPVYSPDEVAKLIAQVDNIHVSEALVDYLQTLLAKTRESGAFVTGLSPRAGLQWLQAAKAHAMIERRDSVLPDDIKILAPYTAVHRLHCADGEDSTVALNKLIESTEIL